MLSEVLLEIEMPGGKSHFSKGMEMRNGKIFE